MTDAELERLPDLFLEIVINDRKAHAIASQPIVQYGDYVAVLDRRRELARHVERTWFRGNEGGPRYA